MDQSTLCFLLIVAFAVGIWWITCGSKKDKYTSSITHCNNECSRALGQCLKHNSDDVCMQEWEQCDKKCSHFPQKTNVKRARDLSDGEFRDIYTRLTGDSSPSCPAGTYPCFECLPQCFSGCCSGETPPPSKPCFDPPCDS